MKKSVPIGVIGIIFEARPNVCVDAAALCLKSGNVCYLRGSRETIETNRVLVELMREALRENGLSEDCIALVQDTSHEAADDFMKMNDCLDLLIPRAAPADRALRQTGDGPADRDRQRQLHHLCRPQRRCAGGDPGHPQRQMPAGQRMQRV